MEALKIKEVRSVRRGRLFGLTCKNLQLMQKFLQSTLAFSATHYRGELVKGKAKEVRCRGHGLSLNNYRKLTAVVLQSDIFFRQIFAADRLRLTLGSSGQQIEARAGTSFAALCRKGEP
jgi:hypothetical protein